MRQVWRRLAFRAVHGPGPACGGRWFPGGRRAVVRDVLVAVGEAAVLVGVIFTAWAVVYLIGG